MSLRGKEATKVISMIVLYPMWKDQPELAIIKQKWKKKWKKENELQKQQEQLQFKLASLTSIDSVRLKIKQFTRKQQVDNTGLGCTCLKSSSASELFVRRHGTIYFF